MTAWGNIDLAVESIKRGARDFIQKPWENERLISLIRVHAELHQALRRARQLELENRLLRAEGMPEFVAAAPSMQPVLELIAPGRSLRRQRPHHRRTRHRQGDRRQASACRLAAIAHAAGRRQCRRPARRNFRKRDLRPRERRIHRCAHRPRRPLRTGQRRHPLPRRNRQRPAAPAGQAAARSRNRRTRARRLFANPPRRCARLLCATNAKLPEEAKAGNFREDLLFRINTVEIHIPALRDRREDIPLLAVHFLNRNRPAIASRSWASRPPPCSR